MAGMGGFNLWEGDEEELGREALEQRLEVARRLPTTTTHERVMRGLDTPEIWAVSFTELGGAAYMLTMCIEHIGTFHDRMIVQGKLCMCKGKPSTSFIIAGLCSAMAHPESQQQTGPPHRPLQLFIAYRMKDSYEAIRSAMESIGVGCELETKDGAKESAAANQTDYKGRNVSKKCNGCGMNDDMEALKRCASCGKVWYCSRECQKADWKVHKKTCKQSQGK